MARALFHAARGRGRTAPNPVVGAVIVSADGVVVGEGFHARAGAPHAEVNALDAAGLRARGATLYCSLEPCCHTGRTGPCVARIAEAASRASWQPSRIRIRSCAAAASPFSSREGSKWTWGPVAPAAVLLNQPFFTLMNEGRPFVTLKAGRQRGRLHCRGARSSDRADVRRRQPARAANSRGNRRDCRRRRGRFSPTIRS